MEILYLLIPLALVLFGVIIWAFSWSVKNDQFEDLDRHGHDLLFDDDLDMKRPSDSSDTNQDDN